VLELEPTPDILAEAVAAARERAHRPVMVGFAAETGSLDRAAEKAARKGVDLLVANDVAEVGSGFGSETNRVTLVVPGAAPEPWPTLSKEEVAHRLLDRVRAIRLALGASSPGAAPPGGAA
jgi:phosphopantothenoylcysteine decarboxylase / phosphopantothenate---cysteine ligase